MYTPLSEVRLLTNVDLKVDGRNTFSFDSEISQRSFFQAKTLYEFFNVNYVKNSGSFKLTIQKDELIESCNYLMFQNSNNDGLLTKWYYAYITDVKYTGRNVAEIFFEIDVIQTWYFEMDIKESFVEREHVSNDTIGTNRIDENLDVGEYTIKDGIYTTDLNELLFVCAVTNEPLGTQITGSVINGVYSGLGYYGFTDAGTLNAFIQNYSPTRLDEIKYIFTVPKNLVFAIAGDGRISAPATVQLPFTVTKNYSSLNGYVPRNNKLWVYPYNYFVGTDNNKTMNNYRYEDFSTTDCGFLLSCNVALDPTVFAIPANYKNDALNFEEILTLQNYPQCSWQFDTYQEWLSRTQLSNAFRFGSSVASIAGGIATGNPLLIGGGVLSVANQIGDFAEASTMANQLRGSASGSGNISQGLQNFGFYKKTIRAEHARVIDDFFDMYGYKVNRVKTPNITGRQNWNYVKLIDPNIFGNIPNKDLSKIHDLFSSGLTFWHSDNVGNYSLPNGIV